MSNSAPSLPPLSATLPNAVLSLDQRAISASQAVHAQTTRFYVPELDALRFLAFFGVFVFHSRSYLTYAGLPYTIEATVRIMAGIGAFGVDLFFVLSAYLITELLLREKQMAGTLDVPSFYLRRILRIWPLYFFFLAFASVLSLFVPTEHLGWKYLLGNTVLSGNWMIIIFGMPQSVANSLWSISLEEQFYLCWPPLVKRLSVRGLATASAVMLITSNLTRVFLYIFIHPTNQTIWFNTFTRLDPIALGVLLALLLHAKKINLNPLERVLFLFASWLILLTVSQYANLNWNSGPMSIIGLFGYPGVALGCCGTVLAMLGIRTHIVRNAALLYLGKISYGLYVYHLLGLWIAEKVWGSPHDSVHVAICFVAGLSATIVLAALSYHFLELPFLRWKKRFTHVPSRPI